MGAYGKQKGIGPPFLGDGANSITRPTVVAEPCRNFKEVASKVNMLSGFIRGSGWRAKPGLARGLTGCAETGGK